MQKQVQTTGFLRSLEKVALKLLMNVVLRRRKKNDLESPSIKGPELPPLYRAVRARQAEVGCSFGRKPQSIKKCSSCLMTSKDELCLMI